MKSSAFHTDSVWKRGSLCRLGISTAHHQRGLQPFWKHRLRGIYPLNTRSPLIPTII